MQKLEQVESQSTRTLEKIKVLKDSKVLIGQQTHESCSFDHGSIL